MATKAGSIVIDIDAGTSKFVLDMEAAKGKIREFGHTTESSHKQAAAAVKALEGNLLNNTRAADAFLVSIKGLAPLISAAFPIIGAIAFAGVIGELGKKVVDFFKGIKEESEKSSSAWNHLLQPMQTTNDELDLSIAKLEKDIAILEGKPANNLAISLAEAKVEADKLSTSLEKNLGDLQKLLKEQDPGYLQTIVEGWGRGENFLFSAINKLGEFRPVDDELKAVHHLKTQQMGLDEKKGVDIDAVRDQHLPQAQQDAKLKQIRDAYARQATSAIQNVIGEIDSALAEGLNKNTPDELERLKQSKIALQNQIHQITSSDREADLTAQKSNLETQKQNDKPGDAIKNRIASLDVELKSAQSALAAVGSSEADQAAAKATDIYSKAVLDLTKALGEYKGALTDKLKQDIQDRATAIAKTDEEIKYKTHFIEVTRSIQERITAQRDLTEAVGATYEVQRQAAIKTAVADFTKSFPSATNEQKNAIGANAGTLFDELRNTQKTVTLQKLQEQIDLEQKLAAVQYMGAEAVRQVELEERIRVESIGKSDKEIAELTQKEIALYNARRANSANANFNKFIDQGAASSNVSGAASGGAEAIRQAKLMNEYVAMAKAGATQDEIIAKAAADWEAHQEQINVQAAQTVTHYSDALAHLEEIKASIEAQYKDNLDNLQVKAAIRDIDNEELRILAEQQLKLGTASGGLKAFFLEAQANAKTTGQIVYDSLNSALDKVSGQFANLFSGKKTSFGQMFKDLGGEIQKETLKSGMQKGLGALGDHFGIKGLSQLAGEKADGSSASKALWVRMAAAKAASSPGDLLKIGGSGADSGDDQASGGSGGIFGSLIPGLAKFGSDTDGLSGSGSGTAGALGGFFGSLFKSFGGGMADGGDVNPYSTYLVGEHAPEFFTPRTAGTITPLNKAMGGQNHYYTIDARGAALGVENRIARSIDMAHTSAIQHAVQASNERSKRVPQKKH